MKFKTVKQIMEHYQPKLQPETGKQLAARLLRDFRKKLKREHQ